VAFSGFHDRKKDTKFSVGEAVAAAKLVAKMPELALLLAALKESEESGYNKTKPNNDFETLDLRFCFIIPKDVEGHKIEHEIILAIEEDPRLKRFKRVCAYMSNGDHKKILLEHGFVQEEAIDYEAMNVKQK